MAGCGSVYNIGFAGVLKVGKSTMFKCLQEHRCNETIPDKTGKSGRCLDKWTHRTYCGPRNDQIEVTLWDTGGMERGSIYSMTKSYFLQTIAYILVYDKGDLETLHNLTGWYQRATNESSVTNTDSLVFSLWGNCTENTNNPVSDRDVRDFADKFEVPPELIFEVNAESGWNVDESYQRVLQAVHKAQTNGPCSLPSIATSFPGEPRSILASFALMAQGTFRGPSSMPNSAQASQESPLVSSYHESSHTSTRHPPKISPSLVEDRGERCEDRSTIVPREEDNDQGKTKSRCPC